MCIGLTSGLFLGRVAILIMTEDTHMDEDRNVTFSLIEESEVTKYLGNKKVHKTTINDWSEAVNGWKSVELVLKASNPTTNTVKKKRVVERSASDLHYGTAGSNSCDDYWSNSSAANDYKISIRCVGDDSETFPIPPWKSNIEQGTYRYIPDNGSYRTLKFMYDDRKEWYTIRKKHPEKVSTAWHQTCKRMQREMKRQLKRDLNTANKDTGSKCSSARSKISSDVNSGDETSRSQTLTDRSEKIVSENLADKPPLPDQHHHQNHNQKRERQLYRNKEPRVKSTQSDGAINPGKKFMNTIHESEPVTPIPQYSIPSGSQMFKSASDLFIENFSHKISALEDEIKRDTKWSRKNESEMTKGQNGGTKSKNTRSNYKENVTPRLPLKAETLTTDIFSVKPVGSKDLRPLEKTKGFGKPYIQNGGDYYNQNGHIPSSRNNPHPINYNSELDKAINSYKTSIENTKQALINTLTGTKINTHQGKRNSKGFSTPSTITICDNNSPNENSHADSHPEAYRQIPMTLDKKPEKKTHIQSVPALLPEISGKRMEVSSISHRLL